MASVSGDEPIRDVVDRMIRDSLQNAENLRQFLEEAVPDLAAGFDCTRARLLDREFPLEDWRRREADLPFEIPYRVGDTEVWALVCVLLEHQSDTDPLIPLRLLLFAVLYWDRQWHDWERLLPPRPPLRLNPVLPIVLYTAPRPWGSNRSLRELLGEPAAFQTFAPDWRPLFWNLSERTPEQLLQTGREWLQTLAVIRVQEESADTFDRIFQETVQRLTTLHGRDQVRWYDLMRIVFTFAAWKRPEPERARLFEAVKAAQDDMSRREEIGKMSEKLGDTLVDIAMAKGALLTSRQILRTLLEDRFGPPSAELVQRIEGTDDLGRLQAAIRQVGRLEKLEDFQL